MTTLVLVATRRCTQRCGYCPVAKTGRPDISPAGASDALRWFAERFSGGKVKLFGGEPLLAPEVVRSTIDHVAREPRLSSVTLCSNGALLDEAWLDYLESQPKAWLTLSLDGRPEDTRRSRPAAPGRSDALASLERILPRLRSFPRLVVTQVVAPELASRASAGFRYLMGLGFRRFNLLPASYVLWSEPQLEALRASFGEITSLVRDEWRAGHPLYLRNLFVRNTHPTFSAGVVVDVDGGVYPSDCVLAELPAAERDALRCGSISAPPTRQQLDERAAAVPGVLSRYWTDEVLRSTSRADSVLDRLFRDLIRDFANYRRKAGRLADARARRPRVEDVLLSSGRLPLAGTDAVPEVWT